MNHIFILTFIFSFQVLASSPEALDPTLVQEKISLSKSDHIIGEHMVNMVRFTEKGYVNQEVLAKILRETEQTKNYKPFVPWLKEVQLISRLSGASEIIAHCRGYTERKQSLPLERVLERIAGNYCRERSLEAINREIDKTGTLSDEATLYIQQNLKFFITKKNKKNFAYFIQAQAARPEILKRLSQEVTAYSVRHDIVPSQEVLQDIVINEQITKLIQDKGFNPLQHQNVFYAEYGKLIELGYRNLESKPGEDKVRDHYHFVKNYFELNQDHLPGGLCLTRLNDFAKAVFRAGFKDLSRDIFKFIIKKNNKEINEDALFFYLWTHLSNNEFREAIKLANQYGLTKNPKALSDSRLKFWIASALEETDRSSDAVSIYEDIVFNNPLSYYAIMSTKKLQGIKPASAAVSFYLNNSLPTNGAGQIDLKGLEEDHAASLVRLRAWAKIDSSRLMRLELKRLRNHSMPAMVVKVPTEKQLSLRSELHLLNAKLIQNAGNYLATFKYLYEALEKREVQFNRSLLEVLYPRPYLEVLAKALKGDSLDPIVVLALIRQESVFNPLARSQVGARGLMQLMPRTARRFKKTLREDHLSNPLLNIELGTKYFKNLLKRYDGNLVYVLAAYNAGEARVERWKGLYFDSEETILKNIEAIPFLETRNYVKLIFRNIFFYKLLLDRKEQLADSREPNKIFDVSLGFNK